jgi:hypothetical protein
MKLEVRYYHLMSGLTPSSIRLHATSAICHFGSLYVLTSTFDLVKPQSDYDMNILDLGDARVNPDNNYSEK